MDAVEAERMAVRRAIVGIADQLSCGQGDVLAHAEALYFLWRRLKFLMAGEHEWPPTDEDFEFLMYVESELDAFPIGKERALWAAESLAELEPEIQGMRVDWGPRIIAVGQRLRAECVRELEQEQ